MATRRILNVVFSVIVVVSMLVGGSLQAQAQTPTPPKSGGMGMGSTGGMDPQTRKMTTDADRRAAAARAAKARAAVPADVKAKVATPLAGGIPDYFGIYPNWSNSPFPASVSIMGDGEGALATVAVDPVATNPTGAPGLVTMLASGTGYTLAATVVTLVGGGGSGAVCTPTILLADGSITSIACVGGTGYNSVPGIRKFVDTLPGLTIANKNNLNSYLSVGAPDQATYPGSDYYEIALVETTQKFHSDLPAAKVREYVQLETPVNAAPGFLVGGVAAPSKHIQLFYPDGITPILDTTGNPVFAYDAPTYLGPTIVANRDIPTRVKFTNYLPTGLGGNLFIPMDNTGMGAGTGPLGGTELYTENRATLHLHGGATPWISDGTPHQWTTPALETTSYPKGVSVQNVPDMPDPGPGSLTFFYTNQQSARLMFYHDHAYGITRLNVYVGEAAGYLIRDAVEQALVAGGTIDGRAVAAETIPSAEIPLVIQDKTFVPSPSQLAVEDPTWNYGSYGNLWFPHVYMPNQNPYDVSGANAMGRWDYGPWFWPPYTGLTNGPVANPYYVVGGAEPPVMPGTPQPSLTPEAFMDTPLVNGTVYPSLTVDPKPYRFRILNAANDRFWNLQLYQAASNNQMWDPITGALLDANAGEVPMVPAVATPGFPAAWPTDGRAGGVPNPAARGPNMVQIGNEGGFLPAPVTIPNQPVGYNYNRRDIVVLNVQDRALFLGPAERADVVVDFSQYAGKTLILYSDAPTPVPAFDPRTDYYTGDPDQTSQGGAPTTLPGYGPNTRTLMQIKVAPVNKVAGDAVTSVTPINPGGLYTQPVATITDTSVGGLGAGATATVSGGLDRINLTTPGAGYTSAPLVGIALPDQVGGVQAVATATVAGGVVTGFKVTVPGSGYSVAPVITITGGGATTDATATSMLKVVGFTVTAGGGGYLISPTVTISDTLPGIGSGATAVANLALGLTPFNRVALDTIFAATATNQSVFGVGQDPVIVPQAAYNSAYNATYPTTNVLPIQATSMTFSPAGAAASVTIPLQPKAIQELFEVEYGRMNATLGVELPNTNVRNQTTIPLGYIDPVTEVINDTNIVTTPIGAANDGTQFWKITHNGVDTHAIHFHLFDVQVINRVGWDGAIRTVDANELGWKETVRMNPLEDAIVAFRAHSRKLPFNLPDSVRPYDVTRPIGSTMGFTGIDPVTGNPVPVVNQMMNLGWEYVWHCHLLGHEENDMMRPIKFNVTSVIPPVVVFATPVAGGTSTAPTVALTWTDPTPVGPTIATWGNPANEIGFRIERSLGNTAFVTIATVQANATTYLDTTVGSASAYRYRVIAFNAAGSSTSVARTITTIAGTRPVTPNNYSAIINPGPQVLEGWTANTINTTGYVLNRTGWAAPINRVRTTISYLDTLVTVGQTYVYSIFAVNGALASAPASQTVVVIQPPNAPTNLLSPSRTRNSITMTWRNNQLAPLPTGFEIQSSPNGTTWTLIGTVGNVTTYTANTLTPNTLYYFRVRAYIAGTPKAYSNWSNVISQRTLP